MRRGSDANILDPLLLPDSSPRDRNKERGRGEERRKRVKGWKGTAIRQKTDICTQNRLLNGTQWKKREKTVALCEVYYNAESFLQQS